MGCGNPQVGLSYLVVSLCTRGVGGPGAQVRIPQVPVGAVSGRSVSAPWWHRMGPSIGGRPGRFQSGITRCTADCQAQAVALRSQAQAARVPSASRAPEPPTSARSS
ncbi:hypothetical protein NDU88_005737 [Pleurodeles waltl]|uniref:Uncharacterized protein n=1 Tax=Pleurodeles waltl TaxID=8319 RepID=A0AAV7L5H4_PLEWA|nr:hypothetical protein NDU88_005737 [Pleurodeles waltl]